MSVLTAIPAQNSVGVQKIVEIDDDTIKEQFLSLSSDVGMDAVKISMLASPQTIDTVVDFIGNYSKITR